MSSCYRSNNETIYKIIVKGFWNKMSMRNCKSKLTNRVYSECYLRRMILKNYLVKFQIQPLLEYKLSHGLK